HRGKTGAPSAAKQIDEKGFNQVVRVMRDQDRFTLSTVCGLREQVAQRFTPRGFDRHLPFLRESGDVYCTKCKINTGVSGKFLHKSCVGVARSSAASMIQMANDQVYVTEGDQPVQQRDGVAASRNSDQIARVRGKLPECSRVVH